MLTAKISARRRGTDDLVSLIAISLGDFDTFLKPIEICALRAVGAKTNPLDDGVVDTLG